MIVDRHKLWSARGAGFAVRLNGHQSVPGQMDDAIEVLGLDGDGLARMCHLGPGARKCGPDQRVEITVEIIIAAGHLAGLHQGG